MPQWTAYTQGGEFRIDFLFEVCDWQEERSDDGMRSTTRMVLRRRQGGLGLIAEEDAINKGQEGGYTRFTFDTASLDAVVRSGVAVHAIYPTA